MNLKSLPTAKDPRPALAGDTLKALAKRSGLSATTLSRVMNHPEMVRPELRARAQAALAEAGYVPNGAARSLASRRTRTASCGLLPTPTVTRPRRGWARTPATPSGARPTGWWSTSGPTPGWT